MAANLRKLAQGQPCQVRLPGICNHNPETTVLAHYPLAGYAGMGMKSPDLLGSWACSSCHDEIDGRTRSGIHSKTELRLYHAEGCLRTIAELNRMGRI
jgi:hypothetical protein